MRAFASIFFLAVLAANTGAHNITSSVEQGITAGTPAGTLTTAFATDATGVANSTGGLVPTVLSGSAGSAIASAVSSVLASSTSSVGGTSNTTKTSPSSTGTDPATPSPSSGAVGNVLLPGALVLTFPVAVMVGL